MIYRKDLGRHKHVVNPNEVLLDIGHFWENFGIGCRIPVSLCHDSLTRHPKGMSLSSRICFEGQKWTVVCNKNKKHKQNYDKLSMYVCMDVRMFADDDRRNWANVFVVVVVVASNNDLLTFNSSFYRLLLFL